LKADVLIADIDRCAETGEVDIDPVGIFGNGVEEAAVPGDAGVDGIVESIGIAGLVEGLVFVWGEIDFEIAFPFGGIVTVAGQEAAAGEGHGEDGEAEGSRHGMVFIILIAIYKLTIRMASGWRPLLF